MVLSRKEVQQLFNHCRPAQFLPVKMLYGAGLRLMECLRLRVGDIDFSRHTVRVHTGKGGKDRITVLPESLVEPLELQLAYERALHQQDLANGFGEAKLSRSLRHKFGKSSRDQ